MDNEDPIIAGEDLARLEGSFADAVEPEADGPPFDPELFELELDGEVHLLPASLKGAFLRQADYTRKTQELADHRRALEVERNAFGQEVATYRGAKSDRLRLMALDEQIADFDGVDWEAYAAEDPQGAEHLWGRLGQMTEARERLSYAVAHADERGQLEAARKAAEAMAVTGERLREEIDGWSPEVAAKLVEYAQAFGVTLEELAQAADARLWKLLHKAWRADQADLDQAGAQALSVRPAVSVGASAVGGGGVRDELGTREWMRRRNAQTGGQR